MMGSMGATSRLVPVTPRRRRGVRHLSCALLCVLVLTGCPSSTDEPEDPAEPTDTQAALQLDLAGSAETLSREARDELQRQVGDVLSTYVVAAFLGDYPRDDFVDSLAAFTSGAAAKAARDLDLLTARRYGEAEAVTAERLRARLSVFVADDEAAGATARVRFDFAVREGSDAGDGSDDTATFRMTGRLSLVPEGDEWRIFAYDVARQDPAQGARP